MSERDDTAAARPEPKAWLIRAGQRGEYEEQVIQHSFASIGWEQLPDLTGVSSRDEISEMLRRELPEGGSSQINVYTGQVWRFRAEVRCGDLVAMPLKKTPQIALGIVAREYHYSPELGHAIAVDWKRADVPRTAVKQDLLHSLGANMAFCQIRRNDGVRRLRELLYTGQDPGARIGPFESPAAGSAGLRTVGGGPVREPSGSAGLRAAGRLLDDDTATDSSEAGFDLERHGLDLIQARVAERFAGQGLSRLVAGVLEAEGFFTEVSPPGPDGGVDIFAGRGPLGLDATHLIVQVKSGTAPVDAQAVRELHGLLATHKAEKALLVAWGGVNRTARRELRTEFFRVRVWDADNLLGAVLRNYGELDEGLRSELPLKRIWTLVEDSDRARLPSVPQTAAIRRQRPDT